MIISHVSCTKLLTFGLMALCFSARCVSLTRAAVMEGDSQRASASWENGTLAPGEHLRSDRADSPLPGLVEGTEPGESGQIVSRLSHTDLKSAVEYYKVHLLKSFTYVGYNYEEVVLSYGIDKHVHVILFELFHLVVRPTR